MLLLLIDLFGGRPIRISVTIPVDVQTFGGISRVAAAMGRIESNMKRANAPIADFRSPRPYRQLNFRVSSPPEASILADPAWLGVFIATIALGVSVLQLASGYPQLKAGLKEISKDLSLVRERAKAEVALVGDAIEGLTNQSLEKLKIGANLYIEDILAGPEALDTLLAATRTAVTLGVRNDERPRIRASEDND